MLLLTFSSSSVFQRKYTNTCNSVVRDFVFHIVQNLNIVHNFITVQANLMKEYTCVHNQKSYNSAKGHNYVSFYYKIMSLNRLGKYNFRMSAIFESLSARLLYFTMPVEFLVARHFHQCYTF